MDVRVKLRGCEECQETLSALPHFNPGQEQDAI